MAGLALALAVPMLSASAASAQSVSTATTLTVNTRTQNSRTQAAVAVDVTGYDGLPATGAVNLMDGSRVLAEVKLDGNGQASTVLTLPAGDHALTAVYAGDATHQISTSRPYDVTVDSGSTPDFQISLSAVSPSTLPLTLTAGDSGTVQVNITPVDNAALTAPMYVTLSCSGLPDQTSCSFSPASIEILPTTPTSCTTGSPAASCPPTSQLVIQTQREGTAMATPPAGRHSSPVAWAILLPGALGLGGLAWGARRRRWLQRLALVALVGLVTTLGATACNPLYYYYNHGPPYTPATPSGTYTITVTGQSTNGVTATTHSTTMVLTVQ